MNSEAEEKLLHNSRNGNLEEVQKLLENCKKGETVVNIDCKGKQFSWFVCLKDQVFLLFGSFWKNSQEAELKKKKKRYSVLIIR